MWWRYFASLLKNNSTIHVQDIFRKVCWICSERCSERYFDHSFSSLVIKIFRPFIRNRLTQETYARFGEDVVKMLWRCGDKDISTIHTPDIFRKISEDVVKVCWKFVEGFMFLNSLFAHIVLYHYSLLLLCFEYFSLKLFLWYHCSIKSCLGHWPYLRQYIEFL